MSRKKNYEVIVRAFSVVVVVGAKNVDDALKLAQEEVYFGDLQFGSAEVERELKDDVALERAKYHADCISEG